MPVLAVNGMVIPPKQFARNHLRACSGVRLRFILCWLMRDVTLLGCCFPTANSNQRETIVRQFGSQGCDIIWLHHRSRGAVRPTGNEATRFLLSSKWEGPVPAVNEMNICPNASSATTWQLSGRASDSSCFRRSQAKLCRLGFARGRFLYLVASIFPTALWAIFWILATLFAVRLNGFKRS